MVNRQESSSHSPLDVQRLLPVTADYLGEVVSSDGKQTLNIERRVRRTLLAVNQIMMRLEQLTLGPWYYECATVLRNSLLISTMIGNAESWYGLSEKETRDLEKVDEELMRRVL